MSSSIASSGSARPRSNGGSPEARGAGRLPIAMQVSYRTPSAFLVSYSVNLSRGGMFLETPSPLPIGTPLGLSFEIPGGPPLEVRGAVTWTRDATGDGLPPGMGVRFSDLDARYGHVIDQLVRGHVGLRALVVAPQAERLPILARYLRSIIACTITEATDAAAVERALAAGTDLILMDADPLEPLSRRTMAARTRAGAGPTPIISMAVDEASARSAHAAGIDQTILAPPSFHDLRSAVLRVLSRPMATRVIDPS